MDEQDPGVGAHMHPIDADVGARGRPDGSRRPPRRSRWTWALAAAGVLVVTTPVLAVGVGVRLLGSMTSSPADDVDARAAQRYRHVDLDTSLGVGWDSATWSVGTPPGWEFAVLDEKGVNRAHDAALECTWTTRQLSRSDALGEYGDRAATTHATEQLVEKFRAGAPEATVTYLLPVAVPFGSGTRAGSAEFLAVRIDDADPGDGSARSTLVTARAMPYLSRFMFTVLRCPRGQVDADPTIWVDLVAGAEIVPAR